MGKKEIIATESNEKEIFKDKFTTIEEPTNEDIDTYTYSEFLKDHETVRRLDPINLPNGLKISTMTLTCKIPVKFNVLRIARYFPLSLSFVHSITFGNNGEIDRKIVQTKSKRKKKKNTGKRNFYNQVTLVASVEQYKINIKLFKNGSIQMTGCKMISAAVYALEKLFNILKMPAHINDKIDDNKRYAEPYIFLNLVDIYAFKIAMINSDFDIGFNINREKLFDKLTKDKYDCTFDPSRHAGVNIHYKNSDKTLDASGKEHVSTILVFDKGKIIITGARNYRQIMECFKFINTYLLENYNKIMRIEI